MITSKTTTTTAPTTPPIMALSEDDADGAGLAAPIATFSACTARNVEVDDALKKLLRVGVGRISLAAVSTLTDADSFAAEGKPREVATLSETPENIVPLEAAVVMIELIAEETSSLVNDAAGKPAVEAIFEDCAADAWSIDRTILLPELIDAALR